MISFFISNISDFIGAVALIVFCGILSFFLTESLRIKLLQSSILDKPNIRSMHSRPVPRGGGWVYVLLVVVWLALLPLFEYFRDQFHLTFNVKELSNFYYHLEYTEGLIQGAYVSAAIGLSLFLLACISWIDDRKGLSAWLRIVLHIVATSALCYFLPIDQPYFLSWLPGFLFIAVAILCWVGFVNLYNFMDGIDGISGVQTLCVCFGLILLSATSNYHLKTEVIVLSSVLVGCSIGFLLHNWHPAKIFLGDVGSVPIGFLVGYCLLTFATAPQFHSVSYTVNGLLLAPDYHPIGRFFAALTLPLYYLADGGITLARRILRGEKFWEAHRTHFYQRSAQAAGRHDVVVLKIAACNVLLIGIAMLELLVSPWFVLAAPLPVALLLHNMAHQRHIGVKSPNG